MSYSPRRQPVDPPKANPAQIGYIRRLMAQGRRPAPGSPGEWNLRNYLSTGRLWKKDASIVIDALLAAPARQPAPAPAPAAPPQHDSPCVCGPYDRCLSVRQADAARQPSHNAALRTLHRAYND